MAPIEFDRRKGRIRQLEGTLTPGEIAAIIRDDPAGEMQFAIRPLFESGQAPVGYRRQTLSEHAHYYSAGKGARSLIIVFSAWQRPGAPISCILQSLRDDIYDVLMLQDPRILHVDHGVTGLGSSLLEVTLWIKTFAGTNGYTELITYGVSLGGYPALRAGILLGAERAISVGGTYVWHIGRLSRQEAMVKAFDVLCPCFSHSGTELVSVVAGRHENDLRALEILHQTFPKCVTVKIDTDNHNVVGFFLKAQLLRLFHACLFEYWHNVDLRSDLLVMVQEAAKHNRWVHMQTAFKCARQAEALQKLKRSRSWRLTEPLRRVGAAIRRLRVGRRELKPQREIHTVAR